MNDNIYDNLTDLVTATTTDHELELIVAAATAAASAELLADLTTLRDELRAIAAESARLTMALTDTEMVVRSVMDLGVAELVDHATTDEQIAAYVTAAEAGNGSPIFGLAEELHMLRDAERADWEQERERDRVFATAAFGAPHIEDPEYRVRVDEIKAGISVEDL
ncbi:hypothetical protein [Mycobacterium sp. 155]|uniref:hypothetical protein n=1 Tax=Mycobacterium sp. 155 TaxID=1157943 RepID=UPI000362408E|nr:hypothetical protein [Mycobacterium sp. 155]